MKDLLELEKITAIIKNNINIGNDFFELIVLNLKLKK
jgi:hypothetical protein